MLVAEARSLADVEDPDAGWRLGRSFTQQGHRRRRGSISLGGAFSTSQLRSHRAHGAAEVKSKVDLIQGGNTGDDDQRGDQAIFDGRDTGLVFDKPLKENQHRSALRVLSEAQGPLKSLLGP